MKMKRFEYKIRKEMLKSLLMTIIVMLTIAIALLSIYSLNMRNYRLDRTMDSYKEVVPAVIASHKELLFEEKQNVFMELIENPNEMNKSQSYSAFYSFNSSERIKSDVIVVNADLETLISTNTVFDENYAFLNYLRIVIDNSTPLNNDDIIRVYRGSNNESYLLYIYPYLADDVLKGYGVSIINGKEFQLVTEDPLANFVLTDNYNNVLATNNTHIQLNTGKYNQEVSSDRNYSEKSTEIFDNLEVTAFVSNERQMSVLFTTLGLLIVATVFVIIFSYRFSKKISVRIGQSLYLFNYELNKVKTVPDHLIKINTDDEFEDLADEVNEMLVELRLAHRKYIELTHLNLNSEKKKLEAQFHPHFLANTLETIRSAMYIDTDIANEVLLRMNSLLRYSIDEADQDISLNEDVEYLKNYLSINKIRFEDFDYAVTIDESLKGLVIPKLFLLPLIENSLKFGFKYRRDLKVNISVMKRDDKVIIRVIDNGNALKEAEEVRINDSISSPDQLSPHHGLRNTKQRIRLLYPNSTFRVLSKLKSTVVEIIIKEERYV